MTDPAAIESLIGIYHADGSVIGELRYWIGARLGRTHCALCDITHGRFTEKSEWQHCRATLPVPFATVHLDQRDPDLRAFTADATPTVVAVTSQGFRTLVGPDALEHLGGQPQSLVDAIVAAADRLGLIWA